MVVWQGVIINCPHRTRLYIDVQAFTYEYLLKKTLIIHDVADGNGAENYKTFKTGNLAAAITAIMTDAKTYAGAASALSLVSIGTVENPNFSQSFTDPTNATTSWAGLPWAFSDKFQLKFDYKDTLNVLQSFGIYAQCDFVIGITPGGLTFQFKVYIGNKQTNLVFEYGPTGAIQDYDAPLDGGGTINDLTGIAADNTFNILKANKVDSASVNLYGKVAGVLAYNDAKNLNALTARMTEEIIFTATPDSEVHVTLNDRAYPLGQYGLGDTVTLRVKDHLINVSQERRIVGIDVTVSQEGYETIKLITNLPRANQ